MARTTPGQLRPTLNAVDIFAGAGGLTEGAKRAGFNVAAAVEIDGDAAMTFRHNHPDVHLFREDVRAVSGGDLLSSAPDNHIHLLMGCAPCQGFCSLTSRKGQDDPRNELILELARLVAECGPDVVLMENVPGLATRGRELFERFLQELRANGYLPNWSLVQMADYGVPQSRRRLLLLAGKGFEIKLPPPTHSRIPDKSKKPWRSLRDAIYGSANPMTLNMARRSGGPQQVNWHVVRDLLPETKARLKAAFPGQSRLDIDKTLLPICHQDGYTGFRNVYTRMSWDLPSSTITAGCTTPAKGRFGHPDRRRTTISVREAATIQTFPATFKFDTTKIDVACQMIGNAVPPRFAKHVSTHIASILQSRAAK